ncbi:MAG: CsiV family protein [Gammaproteobacteria bacterium]
MPKPDSPNWSSSSSVSVAARRPERVPRAALLLLALLLPGAAEARWYQVEVVVFRHLVESATGAEQWPEMTSRPDYGQSIELVTEVEPPVAAPSPGTPAAGQTVPFMLLDKGERATLELERKLRNSSEYAPLVAAAWRQPSFGVGGAKRVHLSDLPPTPPSPPPASSAPVLVDPEAAPPGPKVEGVVALKVARQMAVDVDFIFDHDGTPVRLKESRSLRLREVHYFDHPLFGVLVQVLPWVPPDEDPAAGAGADEPVDEGDATGQSDEAPVEPD